MAMARFVYIEHKSDIIGMNKHLQENIGSVQ